VASREIPITDSRQKLQTVYFSFNAYKLTEDSKRLLQKHAEWLNRNKSTKVEVSGHCDQRGSVEYNLALGERRALAVKKFLVNLGVSANRVAIISYGHQKPADPGQNAAAYAKNRRAEFRVSN
jgi:peptidoglycan-associated lipoprotein